MLQMMMMMIIMIITIIMTILPRHKDCTVLHTPRPGVLARSFVSSYFASMLVFLVTTATRVAHAERIQRIQKTETEHHHHNNNNNIIIS
jgi:hypothetical protein